MLVSNPISHVIFDFNGTLCNTVEVYSIAANNVFSKYGKNLTPEAQSLLASVGLQDIIEKCGDFFKPGKYFDPIVLALDEPQVWNNKPHPDVFNVCAAKFPSPPKDPKNVLVFEDSLFGVQASKAAGMNTIWVVDERFQ